MNHRQNGVWPLSVFAILGFLERERARAMRRTRPTRSAGYSTLEVVIAMSIIGITTAIAAPRYFASVQRTKLERAASLVGADIARAQQNARAYGLDQTVTFNNERYRVTTRTASGDSVADVDLSKEPYEGAAERVRTGSYNSVTFNKHGMPSNALIVALRSGSVLRVLSLSTNGEVEVLEGAPAKAVASAQVADATINAAVAAAPVGPN
jgi:type II secretory pathway pseudopilin PulG